MSERSNERFEVEVTDPALLGGSSMSYLVTLHTDCEKYAEMGREAGANGLRRIEVRRRYSEFEKFYKTLKEHGWKNLPPLPPKRLFGSTGAACVEERRTFFEALLTFCKTESSLRQCDSLVTLLNDVPPPDYEALGGELQEKCKDIFRVPEDEWKLKSEKKTGKVWFRKLGGDKKAKDAEDVEGSDLWMVRSEVTIPIKSDTFSEIYYDLEMWENWTSDFTFRLLEKMDDFNNCMHVRFKTPVIDDRDTVYYTKRAAGMPLEPDAPGTMHTVAQSVLHPLAPKVKGVVRAHVYMSVTTVEPCGDDAGSTRFRTYTHADPKGNVPAAVVNQMAGAAIKDLLKMADYFMEIHKSRTRK